jgi:hypothetical protein
MSTLFAGDIGPDPHGIKNERVHGKTVEELKG